MLSTTGLTTFLANRNRVGAALHAIVKLTDGTSTWYLSDTEMELTDGHVYGILTGMSGIQSEADPISKNWSVSDVTLDFSNAPYRDTTTGRNMRLSDEIGNILGKDVYIYFMVGPCAALSECLLRFSGMIATGDDAIRYDADSVTVICEDKSKFYNKTIPTTYFTDDSVVGEPVSVDVAATPIPLVYGVFAFDKYNPKAGTGLIKGFPLTDKIQRPPFQFAAHSLAAMTDIYYRKDDQPLQWENWSDGITDSDLHADAQLDDDYVWVWMMVYDYGTWNYGFDVSSNTNEAGSLDGSAATLGGIRDFYDNGSERRFSAPFLFAEDQESVFSEAISSNANRNLNTDIDFICKVNELVTHNIERKLTLYHAVGGAAAVTINPATYDGVENVDSGVIGYATASAKSERYCLVVSGVTSAAGADNVINNQTLANIYRAAVRAKWMTSRDLGADSTNPPEEEAWATGQGRAYGAWIDGGARSNSYDEGDLIDTISGVIESILRDVCGVPTALIDEASFDTGLVTTTHLGADPFIQILERRPAFDYIKQLAEQFHMMFVWTANTKARLVPLHSGTTVRTIPFSHVRGGKLSISRIPIFANDMTAKSRYLEFYGECIDSDSDSDATSITAYGTKSYEAEWPNIVDAQVTNLMERLVGGSGFSGLWSNPHNVIDFETVGATNADLENGDRIEFEAATFDGQVKLFGATWASKQFMVTAVEQTLEGTKISAMQL